MSLIKQLWLALVLILLLATGGSFVLSTMASKYYLEQELQIKNNDNATTLALSMTQLPKDLVTLDLLVAAQFDAGHYHYISLTSPDGKVLSERVNPKPATKAPRWFTQLFPIKAQAGMADVQDGWKQFGLLKVQTDENFAYDKLWDAMILIALWALLIGLVSCYISAKVLKKILSPLNDVVNQAQAIAKNQFVSIEVPRTKEFKAVVLAMNALSHHVKKTVSQESARLDALLFEKNFDQTTGLMNHDYFAKKLAAEFSHEEYFSEGVLVICRIANLAQIDHALGYIETNALLKRMGEALRSAYEGNHHIAIGRLSGADFAVFSNQAKDAYAFGSEVKTVLEKISSTSLADMDANILTLSMQVTRSDSANKVLAIAHHFLEEIDPQQTGALHAVSASEFAGEETADQAQWASLIESALAQKRIKLESYPVVNAAGQLIHEESPVRLQLSPEGKWYCAGEFITIATQLNLMPAVDRLVVETAMNALEQGAKPIGLNISASAMCSTAFTQATFEMIKQHAHIASRLYFEVSEQAAFEHLAEFRQFFAKLKALGCHIGIEHVGSRISRLGELHDIGLNYIKIDASIIRDVHRNEANKTLLRGLGMIAHAIGVMAIAEGVQSIDELETLKQLGLDGMTGPAVRVEDNA